jgi:two-component system LytT family response regulator
MNANKIPVLVVDDEKESGLRTQALINEHCSHLICNDIAYSANEATDILQSQNEVQIVFLDIAMPDKDGFDFINDFENYLYPTVFVSSYDNYALRAIKANAIDFILKPVSIDDLINAEQKVIEKLSYLSVKQNLNQYQQSLEHVISHLRNNTPLTKITVPTGNGLKIFPISTIMYLEVVSDYTIIHLDDRTQCVVIKPLKDFEQILDTNLFVRVHRSFIVNMDFIKECNHNNGLHIILTDNKKIEVARRRKELLLENLKAFTINFKKNLTH